MKDKILIFAVIAGFSFFPSVSGAVSDKSADDIVKEIMQAQNAAEKEDIDVSKISDEQFEELGDAIMDLMMPDQSQHEYMDQMMGGAGSESLKNMHIAMAKNYISGNFSGTGCPMMARGKMTGGNMMSGGMMGNFNADGYGYGGFENSMMNSSAMPGMMSGFNMMGKTGYNLPGVGAWSLNNLILPVLFWILAISGLVWLIKALFLRPKKPEDSALNILKMRYVRGEIEKKEFEEKKRELMLTI